MKSSTFLQHLWTVTLATALFFNLSPRKSQTHIVTFVAHGASFNNQAFSCELKWTTTSISKQDRSRFALRIRLRQEFMNYFKVMHGPYRYAASKFLPLLQDKWSDLKALTEGRDFLSSPSFLEIHLGEPCNFACDYCRQDPRNRNMGLRVIPLARPEMFMPRQRVFKLLESAHRLNTRTEIRYSGIIGEPGLHPDLIEILDKTVELGLPFGFTTNGVPLDRPDVLRRLTKAAWVHFSMDGATEETYMKRKHATKGDLEKVLRNERKLADLILETNSKTRIIVSLLLQPKSYYSQGFSEIGMLCGMAREVGADTFEIKMQHYDPRHPERVMAREEVREAYGIIDELGKRYDSRDYRVYPVQSLQEALDKIQPPVAGIIKAKRCWVNRFGLSSTASPLSELQHCCQYAMHTLGIQGNLARNDLVAIWSSSDRLRTFEFDPRRICDVCSPSDLWANNFIQWLLDSADKDNTLLPWIEQHFVKRDLSEKNLRPVST